MKRKRRKEKLANEYIPFQIFSVSFWPSSYTFISLSFCLGIFTVFFSHFLVRKFSFSFSHYYLRFCSSFHSVFQACFRFYISFLLFFFHSFSQFVFGFVSSFTFFFGFSIMSFYKFSSPILFISLLFHSQHTIAFHWTFHHICINELVMNNLSYRKGHKKNKLFQSKFLQLTFISYHTKKSRFAHEMQTKTNWDLFSLKAEIFARVKQAIANKLKWLNLVVKREMNMKWQRKGHQRRRQRKKFCVCVYACDERKIAFENYALQNCKLAKIGRVN